MAEQIVDTTAVDTQANEPQTVDTPVDGVEANNQANEPQAVDTQPATPQNTVLGGQSYHEFNVPEGFNAPDEAFLNIAKELNIPQEGVQKMVDYYTGTLVPQLIKEQQEAINAQNDEWYSACEKELGKQGIDVAKSAYQQFATPELTKMLQETGLASHPALVRMFSEIGKQMGEGVLIKGGAAASQKRQADILFGGV